MITIKFKNGNKHALVKRMWPDDRRRILFYVDAHDNHVWTVKLSDIETITANESKT